MAGRVFERKKRRMPCNVTFEGQQHNALVLDISPAGLFIQTSVKAKPGDRLDLKLSIPGETQRLSLQVEIVRKLTVPARLLAVAHGGVGVRILNAPEAYYNFIKALGSGTGSGEIKSKSAGQKTPTEGAAAAEQPQRNYRVRVKQIQGPRSRILDVAAGSEEDARSRALAELGEGWGVLQVELR
jgi:hypothetical protein